MVSKWYIPKCLISFVSVAMCAQLPTKCRHTVNESSYEANRLSSIHPFFFLPPRFLSLYHYNVASDRRNLLLFETLNCTLLHVCGCCLKWCTTTLLEIEMRLKKPFFLVRMQGLL